MTQWSQTNHLLIVTMIKEEKEAACPLENSAVSHLPHDTHESEVIRPVHIEYEGQRL